VAGGAAIVGEKEGDGERRRGGVRFYVEEKLYGVGRALDGSLVSRLAMQGLRDGRWDESAVEGWR
jgi:hypothetical protein